MSDHSFVVGFRVVGGCDLCRCLRVREFGDEGVEIARRHILRRQLRSWRRLRAWGEDGPEEGQGGVRAHPGRVLPIGPSDQYVHGHDRAQDHHHALTPGFADEEECAHGDVEHEEHEYGVVCEPFGEVEVSQGVWGRENQQIVPSADVKMGVGGGGLLWTST